MDSPRGVYSVHSPEVDCEMSRRNGSSPGLLFTLGAILAVTALSVLLPACANQAAETALSARSLEANCDRMEPEPYRAHRTRLLRL